jgi:tetratricopeptide (TPR) repeat protein
LSEIAGAEAPPPVTVTPLEEAPSVQEACEQAWAQIEDGDFQGALDALDGVRAQPAADRYEVHYLTALAKARMGQFQAARESAETAARLGHGHADVHFLLANLYLRQGKTESAIAHYRTATLAAERELNNPSVTLAWYYLGAALAQTGHLLAAAQAYEQFDTAVWQTHPEQRNAEEILRLLTGRPHGMVPERLELLEQLEQDAEALRVATWAREVWPDDARVAGLYAQALVSAGQPERAFTFCRERLEAPDTDFNLLPVAVDAAHQSGRLDEWIDEVRRAVEAGGEVGLAAELTRELNRAELPGKVVELGRTLLARVPTMSDVVWQVAGAQHAAGDLRGTLETLIAFVRHQPELAEIPQRRLATWMGWFDSGVDVAALVKALRAAPNADFATDFVLGVSALAADELTLAEELLQSCLAARPDFALAHVVQGRVLLASYQWEAAKEQARAVLEERPDLAAAHYLLAAAHDGLDENEEAERAFKQAIRLRPQEPAYKLALAQHYRRLDNLLGAQRYFQEALTEDPGRGAALEGLIDCYLRGNKTEIARTQLERIDRDALPADALRRIDTTMRFLSGLLGDKHLAALEAQLEQHPDDVLTARLLGAGLYVRGAFDEAFRIIEKVRARVPEDYHLTSLLANVHAARGEFDQAIGVLEELAKRFPNRLTVLQPLAQNYFNDFRLEQGRVVLRRLIELDEEGRNRYRELLLRSYVEFRECDEALELIAGWIEQDPASEELGYGKAQVLIDCDRKPEAFELIEQRLDEQPADPRRRIEFVTLGVQAEHYAEVAARVRRWLQDDPKSATLTETLVDLLINADQADEALDVARGFEGTYAESIQRRVWMGRCHAAKGDTDAALAEFDPLLDERAISDEARGAVRGQIITALIHAERYEEALGRCRQWLAEAGDLKPEAALALQLETLLYKQAIFQTAGRLEECAEVMESLLARRPDHPGLLNDLGYTWVDLGKNVERATGMIQRAVAAEPWNAAYIDSLGWAYYKAGDFSNAQKYLARAVRLRDGQDPVVYDHLGDAAYRLGDRDAAGRHWRQALSLLRAETSDLEQKRNAEVMAAVRAKLAALERSEPPEVAPTAAEQRAE